MSSLHMLTTTIDTRTKKCVLGIEADEELCRVLCTSAAGPVLGAFDRKSRVT